MKLNDEDESAGEVESLWGKMDPNSFGDRATRGKPVRKRPQYPLKRRESVLTDTADDVDYQPKSKENKAVYDEMFSIIQEELGEPSPAVVGGALDQILKILQEETLENSEKVKEVTKVLNPTSDNVSGQLRELIQQFQEESDDEFQDDYDIFLDEEDEEPGQEHSENMDEEPRVQGLKDNTDGVIPPKDLRVGWWNSQPRMIELEKLALDQGGRFHGKELDEAWRSKLLTKVSCGPKPLDSDEKLVDIKGFQKLNCVQSQVYQTDRFKANNILLCAPPGTGRTSVAAAVHTIMRQIELNKDSKIVYVAGMNALASEVVRKFSDCLKDYQATLLSGDQILSVQEIQKAQIIVTTPENWDIFTRKPENLTYTQLVRLVIIDDILLFHHPTRGPVLEAIVARTRMQRTDVRLVGLSPTRQSCADVASFLQVDLKDGLFEFDCSYRPVNHFAISRQKPFPRFQLMNDACSDKVLAAVAAGNHQVLVFVHSRKDAARTARAIRDADAVLKINSIDEKSRKFIQDKIGSIVSDDLKDLLPHGFALLHAGLTKNDRQIVERLFEEKHLTVLISTRSEVWGMNLSADTVVIKGTEEYNPEKGAWMELNCMEIMRMIGVGRGSGSGFIITGEGKADQVRIESQFISKLADQLNAEIVLGTVHNAKEAFDWLSHTYLYFCMLRNPKLYGLAQDKTLEGRIADLVHSAATILDKNNMVKYDRTSGDFQATELGRIASYYCITHGTIATFNKHLKPKMGHVEIYRLLSLSEELKYVAVRQDERKELAKLLAGDGIPNPIEEALERRSAKISVLLQAYISRLQVESLSLSSDMVYIAESAGRLVRALFEMVLRQGWAQLAKKALEMSKMIRKRMWSDQTPLHQFQKPSLETLSLQRTSTGMQVKLGVIEFPWDDVVAEGLWIFVEDSAGHKILCHKHFIADKTRMDKNLVLDLHVPDLLLSECVLLLVSDARIGSQIQKQLPRKRLISAATTFRGAEAWYGSLLPLVLKAICYSAPILVSLSGGGVREDPRGVDRLLSHFGRIFRRSQVSGSGVSSSRRLGLRAAYGGGRWLSLQSRRRCRRLLFSRLKRLAIHIAQFFSRLLHYPPGTGVPMSAASTSYSAIPSEKGSAIPSEKGSAIPSEKGQGEEVPPEHVRKIISMRDRDYLASEERLRQNRLYIGALKFVPRAAFKLLENMPMPWEEVRDVKVLYHLKGAVTIVNETPWVVEPIYRAQWGSMLRVMQTDERNHHPRFERMMFPPFGDDSPPSLYAANLLDVDPPEPLQLELNSDELQPYLNRELTNGPSSRMWKLSAETMANLHKLAGCLKVDMKEGEKAENGFVSGMTSPADDIPLCFQQRYPQNVQKDGDSVQFLASSKAFERTTLDWVEVGLQVCQQGYHMLNLLTHKKKLDRNFSLMSVKRHNTNEQETLSSESGFHLCREILQLTKLVVDAHVQFRLGRISAFQLADGLQYIFSNGGQLTGTSGKLQVCVVAGTSGKLQEGDVPYITTEEAEKICTTAADWLKSRQQETIPFPVTSQNNIELLRLAIDGLKKSYTSAEELSVIQKYSDNIGYAMERIQKLFLGIKSKDLNSLDKKIADGLNLQTQSHRPFWFINGVKMLKRLLRLVMNPSIADYVVLSMSHNLIKGLPFASFVLQYYGLALDLLVLGVDRASEIAGTPQMSNEFLTETHHRIRLYCRYIDKVHVILKFTKDEAQTLIQNYLADPNNENVVSLTEHDDNLGKSVFWDMKNRLPQSVTTLKWENSFVSVYSSKNPNLLFSMCGFEVRIVPKSRMTIEDSKNTGDGAWNLQDEQTKETTAVAFLQVDDEHMKLFENSVRQILMSTTFIKTVDEWNTVLIGLVAYFREAILNSKGLLDLMAHSEDKIQKSIQRELSPRMLSRLPPIIFYTPREIGGLGMLSMGHIVIPESDTSQQKKQLIPSLYRYINPWKREFVDSQQVWEDIALQRHEAKAQHKHLSLVDLEDSWDRGVPRINTLFQKDRHTLAYDKGWRIRALFNQYRVVKRNPLWWTQETHDGKLWNLNKYGSDVMHAFGGSQQVLERTIFKGLGLATWNDKFFEELSDMEMWKTRFCLWWSPTINRESISVGIFSLPYMTGPVIHSEAFPYLESAVLNVFKGQSWRSVFVDLVFYLQNSLKTAHRCC
ncbi:unnamed protein product [Microthlaspi erraticum]|uniref:Helicase ATP-binding domain-containing protein n=1 Tax=Microthlaspi erraticum TaxID=1685480 RepID=A0A6D2KQN6_9BRAS|nr:unnamed protein product [Microthlaspi erraticum]